MKGFVRAENIVLYEPLGQVGIDLVDWFGKIGAPIEVSLECLVKAFASGVVLWGSWAREEVLDACRETGFMEVSQKFRSIVGEDGFDFGLKHGFHGLQKALCRKRGMA